MATKHYAFIVNLWKKFIADSLYRNSAFLLINLVMNAGSGFFFVIICTRLYSQADFGRAAALLAALNLAVILANFGMNRTLLRYFGTSESKSRDLATKLSIVVLGAILSSVVIALFFSKFNIADKTFGVGLLFVLAAVLGSMKSLLDNVFISTRSSVAVLIENGAYNVTRLVLPAALLSIGFIGIFSSTAAAYLISVLITFYLLKKRLGLRISTAKPSLQSMRGKWKFAFGSYSYEIIGSFTGSVLPIIVISKFGPIESALWYTVIQIVFFLLLMSGAVNDAMFAEISNVQKNIRHYVAKAATAMYAILLPVVAAVIFFAPRILSFFGEDYVSAYPILRLMALFTLLAVISYMCGSILAYYKKVFYITLVNLINTCVIVVYSLIFAADLKGIAIAWILGEVTNVTMLLIGALYIYKSARRRQS